MSKPLNLVLKEKIIGDILYEDEEGTTGEVTLNKDITNYKELEIYAKYGTRYICEKMPTVEGARIVLEIVQRTGTGIVYLRFSECTLQSNKITRLNFSELLAGNTTYEDTDIISIYKVVGYK